MHRDNDWGHANLSTMTAAPPAAAGSSLSGYSWAGGNSKQVVYLDGAGHVHELYIIAGSPWRHADLTATAGWPTSPDTAQSDAYAVVDSQINELDQKRDAAGERLVLNNTDMIREAVDAVFDAAHAAQAVVAWQSCSGAAHGFVWPMLGTTDTAQSSPDDHAGIAEFQVGR